MPLLAGGGSCRPISALSNEHSMSGRARSAPAGRAEYRIEGFIKVLAAALARHVAPGVSQLAEFRGCGAVPSHLFNSVSDDILWFL